ncbi:hypothetical protein Rmet_4492 (plasmid) [Cupriavidus metallidurans CH34]|uniref:Uncharacterized protein n=1 Tax=Cupriavidus metallidurans (strain ATCC 43123 / DSM 2839 / NBRC 102507 / CH34) TaxID=266264 RepID=Q1LER9_CUPMC|nr:hypothetical protein Rmet_4492 [Cupriavidus metallidurans CH34]
MRPLPSSLLLAILRRIPAPSGLLPRILSLPRIVFDLLLAPVLMTVSVLASLLLPIQAHAQAAGGAVVDYAYQRTMSRIVAGSAAGLQMSSPTTMNIINAGKVVGSFAVTEKRLIDLATLAKYARASTVPGIIALAGTELLAYGLEKCADGTWCTREANKPNGSNVDWGSTGWMTAGGASCTSYSCSAEAACRAAPNIANGKYPLLKYIVLNGGTQAYCYSRNAADNPLSEGGWGLIQRQSSYVDPPGSLVPASDANIETAWKGAFQAKPFLQEKVWGFEDQSTQNQQWADALAQLAAVAAPSTVTVADPTTSTTTPTGTTKVDRSCTYAASANADAGSQKDKPASVGVTCTTTTTAPDGTVTQQTTKTDASPQGGQTVPQKVDIDTCGLPGKPACKIDETGTKAQSDVDTALQQRSSDMDSRLSITQQAANDSLSEVERKHDSVHIFTLFNVFPTFASEQCENPTVPGVVGGSLPVDICTYYYMLKDVMGFGVALFVLIDSVQVVREAVKV